MTNTEKTIAEQALETAEAKAIKKTASKAVEKQTTKYKGGMYRSDKFMRIIKTLSYEHQKDASGQIQKTYGTWSRENNVIVFQKNTEIRLSDEDVALPTIQRLIDSKSIYRVGD